MDDTGRVGNRRPGDGFTATGTASPYDLFARQTKSNPWPSAGPETEDQGPSNRAPPYAAGVTAGVDADGSDETDTLPFLAPAP